MLHHAGQHFLQEDTDKSQNSQNDENFQDGSHAPVSGHDKEYHGDNASIEYKSCHCILTEPGVLYILLLYSIDDSQHNIEQDHEHTEGNSQNEYGIDVSKSRKPYHIILRMNQGIIRQEFLKPEKAVVDKAEYGGENSRGSDNGRQRFSFPFVQQKTSDQQAEPLSEISKHNTENKSIGQCQIDGWIKFMVPRQSVHPHKHLKRLEEPRVLQFCRRLGINIGVIVFHHAEDLGLVLNVLLECSRVFFRHPSAEDVKGLGFGLCQGSHLTHIKVTGITLQKIPCLQDCPRFLLQQTLHLPAALFYACVNPFDSRLRLPVFLLRSSAECIRHVNPLKMKRRVNRIHLLVVVLRGEIHAVDILAVGITLVENRVAVFIDVILKFCKKLSGNPSEPIMDKMIIHHILEPDRKTLEGFQRCHLFFIGFAVIPQSFSFILVFHERHIGLIHRVKRFFNGHRPCGRLLSGRKHGHILLCLLKCFLIRIDFNIRSQRLNRFQLGKRILKMNFIAGQVLLNHTVNVRLGAGDAKKFHFQYQSKTPPKVYWLQ